MSDVKGGNYSDAENNDDDAGSAANSPKVNSGSIKNSEDAISATNSPDNINSGVKDIENIF